MHSLGPRLHMQKNADTRDQDQMGSRGHIRSKNDTIPNIFSISCWIAETFLVACSMHSLGPRLYMQKNTDTLDQDQVGRCGHFRPKNDTILCIFIISCLVVEMFAPAWQHVLCIPWVPGSTCKKKSDTLNQAQVGSHGHFGPQNDTILYIFTISYWVSRKFVPA